MCRRKQSSLWHHPQPRHPFTHRSSTQLQSQRGAAAPVPLPQAGSRGCGAAAPPFSAHCTHPRAAELCVPPWQGVTPVHHELLIIPPCIFFSTIHHFSINALLPGVAAQFVPYKAGVPEQSSPLPGPAPASFSAKLSLLAVHDSFPHNAPYIFLQGWLKISQFDLPYAKDRGI